MPERVPLSDAIVRGLRRAGVHVVRAGYELVRGGMVLAEELAGALGSDDGVDDGDVSEHIAVEDDTPEEAM